MLGDALIYAAVMIASLSLMIGWDPDGERQTQAWTAWALGQPFGRSLVGVVGFPDLGVWRGRDRLGNDDPISMMMSICQRTRKG